MESLWQLDTYRIIIDEDLNESNSLIRRLRRRSQYPISINANDNELLREQTIIAEINQYRALPSIEFEEDPLVWWRINQPIYPRLANLAKKKLCIPSTSAASERAFSSGGRLISKSRTSLEAKTLQI